MTAKPRTLAQLYNHPWVKSVSDERSSGCGIWVYLTPGYEWDGSHTIHEGTVRECCAAFSAVVENPADELLQDDPRPVLPGEQTPPAARSHGDAAPTLPQLRSDAAAGRPVSLAAVAAAKLAEARAQRRQRREAAAMEMEGVAQLLRSLHDSDWITWRWEGQAGRAVDTAAALGWVRTRNPNFLELSRIAYVHSIECHITATGRAALASHDAG